MSLKNVKPVPVTDVMLISSTVPESEHAEWAAGTPYTSGARVSKAATHKVYESIVAANVGHDPAGAGAAAYWSEVGPTNRWACFDRSNSTQTRQATGISYVLRLADSIAAFAALNVVGCISVRVRMQHPTYGTVYDTTTALASLPAQAGWWEWTFGQRTAPPLMVLTDLPSYPGCDLLVDFVGTVDLAVGVLMFGSVRSIGEGVRMGARVGIQDYSRKERNAFGDVQLVERAYAKRASFEVPILAAQVDEVVEFLASVRATPCLWIGSGLYASTVVFGFFKEFEVVIAYRAVAECSISLEGLT